MFVRRKKRVFLMICFFLSYDKEFGITSEARRGECRDAMRYKFTKMFCYKVLLFLVLFIVKGIETFILHTFFKFSSTGKKHH